MQDLRYYVPSYQDGTPLVTETPQFRDGVWVAQDGKRPWAVVMAGTPSSGDTRGLPVAIAAPFHVENLETDEDVRFWLGGFQGSIGSHEDAQAAILRGQEKARFAPVVLPPLVGSEAPPAGMALLDAITGRADGSAVNPLTGMVRSLGPDLERRAQLGLAFLTPAPLVVYEPPRSPVPPGTGSGQAFVPAVGFYMLEARRALVRGGGELELSGALEQPYVKYSVELDGTAYEVGMLVRSDKPAVTVSAWLERSRRAIEEVHDLRRQAHAMAASAGVRVLRCEDDEDD